MGTLLASGGLFGIVYGLVRAPIVGWSDTLVLTGLFAGVALLCGFVRHGSRHQNPMLPMRLFRSRAFAGINAASLLMFLGMFGSIFLLAQFMQGVLGYSPTEAGLRMLPWTGMPMLVAPIAGYLSDRIGGRPVVAAGLFLQAVGLGWFAAVVAADVSYAAQLPALIVSGIGMSLYFAPASNLVMSSARPDRQGHRLRGQQRHCARSAAPSSIAVMASIFSAQGGYGSAQQFVSGIRARPVGPAPPWWPWRASRPCSSRGPGAPAATTAVVRDAEPAVLERRLTAGRLTTRAPGHRTAATGRPATGHRPGRRVMPTLPWTVPNTPHTRAEAASSPPASRPAPCASP